MASGVHVHTPLATTSFMYFRAKVSTHQRSSPLFIIINTMVKGKILKSEVSVLSTQELHDHQVHHYHHITHGCNSGLNVHVTHTCTRVHYMCTMYICKNT